MLLPAMQEQSDGFNLKGFGALSKIQPYSMINVATFSEAIAQLGILWDALEEFRVCSAKPIKKAQKIEGYY